MATETTLAMFTPLPPARNGIADYSAMLLEDLRGVLPCAVYCEDGIGMAPEGVEVRDAAQAFRHLAATSPVVHQIGNNGGHVFALEALRRFGGTVSLHDLNLLYLYELASPRLETILAGMQRRAPRLGRTFARHWKDGRLKTGANYVLFDMCGEILTLADALIVHSAYAKRRLCALYGEEVGEKVSVIPHFAPVLKVADRAAARLTLGIATDETIVLTSGFATKAKRFDWMIDALGELAARGIAFRWIHAGEERPTEFALTKEVARRPALAARTTLTGYVSEEALDAYILAADVVANLRFPSVGESSGTLARAFAGGRCAIVNDTAAYAELPRDAVVHIPSFGTVPALVAALAGLIADPDLRQSYGERAQLFAKTSLARPKIAADYAAVARSAAANRQDRPITPVAPSVGRIGGPPAPGTTSGPFETTLWFEDAEALVARSLAEPGFLHRHFGPETHVETTRFITKPGERARIGLTVGGRVG